MEPGKSSITLSKSNSINVFIGKRNSSPVNQYNVNSTKPVCLQEKIPDESFYSHLPWAHSRRVIVCKTSRADGAIVPKIKAGARPLFTGPEGYGTLFHG